MEVWELVERARVVWVALDSAARDRARQLSAGDEPHWGEGYSTRDGHADALCDLAEIVHGIAEELAELKASVG